MEVETKKVVGKGIYAKQTIAEGTLITEDLLVGKRPIVALGMEQYELIIGQKARTTIEKDSPIGLNDIVFES